MWSKAARTSPPPAATPAVLVFLIIPALLTLFKVLLLDGEEMEEASGTALGGVLPLLLFLTALPRWDTELRGSLMDLVTADERLNSVEGVSPWKTELERGLRIEAYMLLPPVILPVVGEMVESFLSLFRLAVLPAAPVAGFSMLLLLRMDLRREG